MPPPPSTDAPLTGKPVPSTVVGEALALLRVRVSRHYDVRRRRRRQRTRPRVSFCDQRVSPNFTRSPTGCPRVFHESSTGRTRVIGKPSTSDFSRSFARFFLDASALPPLRCDTVPTTRLRRGTRDRPGEVRKTRLHVRSGLQYCCR